ncbi:MAG: hypothetical protein MHMPM18_002353 [Marteilia pararefringens]
MCKANNSAGLKDINAQVERFDKSGLKRTNSEDSAERALDVAKTHMMIANNKNLGSDLKKVNHSADDKPMINQAKIQYAINHNASEKLHLNQTITQNRDDQLIANLKKRHSNEYPQEGA